MFSFPHSPFALGRRMRQSGSVALLSGGVLGMLIGCGGGTTHGAHSNIPPSGVNAVDLPVTPVDDQGKIGFCWAHGTIGLIESTYKTRTGGDLNLSEEALGFYRLAERITSLIQSSATAADLIDNFTRGVSEGFYTRLPDEKRVGGELDALDLVKKYGLVPESAWNVSFPDAQARQSLMNAIRTNVYALSDGRNRSSITVEEVIEKVLVGEGAFPSRPPSRFLWEGQEISATAFLTDVVKFDTDAFAAVEAASESELESFATVMKSALAQGYSVPFGYSINVDRLSGMTFGAADVSLDNPVAFAADGGHIVLVTDFVNEGGVAGAIPADELAAEVAKPFSALAYLRVKNSWGVGEKLDSSGKVLSNSPDGYYHITHDYLVGSARAASKGWMPLIAVVPRSLLRTP
jgi:hypothetical protein